MVETTNQMNMSYFLEQLEQIQGFGDWTNFSRG
jgi:hypothetical protein